jgi:hypothetical protein
LSNLLLLFFTFFLRHRSTTTNLSCAVRVPCVCRVVLDVVGAHLPWFTVVAAAEGGLLAALARSVCDRVGCFASGTKRP